MALSDCHTCSLVNPVPDCEKRKKQGTEGLRFIHGMHFLQHLNTKLIVGLCVCFFHKLVSVGKSYLSFKNILLCRTHNHN